MTRGLRGVRDIQKRRSNTAKKSSEAPRRKRGKNLSFSKRGKKTLLSLSRYRGEKNIAKGEGEITTETRRPRKKRGERPVSRLREKEPGGGPEHAGKEHSLKKKREKRSRTKTLKESEPTQKKGRRKRRPRKEGSCQPQSGPGREGGRRGAK